MKIYQLFDESLSAVLSEITEFKTIEPYNQQYQNTEKEDAKAYPAVYYELLEPVNWEALLEGLQVASVQARVHVVEFSVKREKESLHDLAQAVFKKLNGSPLYHSGAQLTCELARVSSSVPKRYRQVKVLTIDFKFLLVDVSNIEIIDSVSGLAVKVFPNT